MNFTQEEKEALYWSVCCRLNIVETGDHVLSKQDMINMGRLHRIKVLNEDQKKLVAFLTKLKIKLLHERTI